MAEKPSTTPPRAASLPHTRAAIAARLSAGLDALARIIELEDEIAAGMPPDRALALGDAQAAHLWSAGLAFASASELARRTSDVEAGQLADVLHAFVLIDCPAELHAHAERLAEDYCEGPCPLGRRAAEITGRVETLFPTDAAVILEDGFAPGV